MSLRYVKHFDLNILKLADNLYYTVIYSKEWQNYTQMIFS